MYGVGRCNATMRSSRQIICMDSNFDGGVRVAEWARHRVTAGSGADAGILSNRQRGRKANQDVELLWRTEKIEEDAMAKYRDVRNVLG